MMNETILRPQLYRMASMAAESQQLALREARGRVADKCREIGLTQDQLIALLNVLGDMDREIGDTDHWLRISIASHQREKKS